MSDQTDKSKPARDLPLRICKSDEGYYSVILAGIDLTGVLVSNGVHIEWFNDLDAVRYPCPKVTLTFAPDSLALDLDAELVAYLKAKSEVGQ